MSYGRHVVINRGFEDVVGAVSRAIRDEDLYVLARVDVRDHFKRTLAHDCRQYTLLHAWWPAEAFEGIRVDLDAGPLLPATFAVYELADGETAVVAVEPFAPVIEDRGWRRDQPALAAIADRESAKVARVLDRLGRHCDDPHVAPAA